MAARNSRTNPTKAATRQKVREGGSILGFTMAKDTSLSKVERKVAGRTAARVARREKARRIEKRGGSTGQPKRQPRKGA